MLTNTRPTDPQIKTTTSEKEVSNQRAKHYLFEKTNHRICTDESRSPQLSSSGWEIGESWKDAKNWIHSSQPSMPCHVPCAVLTCRKQLDFSPATFTHLPPMQYFLFSLLIDNTPQLCSPLFSLPPFSTLSIFLLKLFFWNPDGTSTNPTITTPRQYAYKCKLLKPGIFMCFVLSCISSD